MKYISGRIAIDENNCNGKPQILGKRKTDQTILEFISTGNDVNKVLLQYQLLEYEDIIISLKFAGEFLDKRHTFLNV